MSAQSTKGLVAEALMVEAVDEEALQQLLAMVMAPHRANRRVWFPAGEGAIGVWPPDGGRVQADGPHVGAASRDEPAVVFDADAWSAFCARFRAPAAPETLARVAGLVAPLLPALHPEHVTGVNYALAPGPRARRLLAIVGKFLPKRKAVALVLEPEAGRPLGLYIAFNARRCVAHIVGHPNWPQSPEETGAFKALGRLGTPVEIGVRLTARGTDQLLHAHLNRRGFGALVRAGDLRFEPLPLGVKMALKAAGIA